MCYSETIEKNFKIGILKELHERQLISKNELEEAIKIIEKIMKGEIKK